MKFPTNLKYSKDHEWARLEKNESTIGVTDHAQSSLGDVVFVDLPAVGKVLKKGDTFGVVESIKAVSDLYAPVSGKITAINEALKNDPSLVNRDPYGEAWIIKLEVTDPASASDLLDANAYEKFVSSVK
jgi:glycine cleavage system H protein